MVLAIIAHMSLICEHCDEMIVGNAYRVTSEEDGIVLLDMIVCSLCGMEAKRLQLHTEVVDTGGSEAAGLYKRDQRTRMRM
jgi:RNase P subunit RPR2